MVFPCYNEEEALPSSMEKISALLNGLKSRAIIAESSFALYIDDGSSDRTWALIEAASLSQPGGTCRGVKLAGNAGHQNALYAGLMSALEAGIDCAISMDVDLQDDLAAIPLMLADFAAGCDLVYGVKQERKSYTFFKKITADIYYKLMRFMKVDLIPHHADCRLCSRLALEALSKLAETNLFLRAIFPALGLRSSTVEYAIKERLYGSTKYTTRKMLSLAWRGITSFSIWPLRLAGLFSVIGLAVAVLLTIGVFVSWWLGYADATPGWSSLMIVVIFMGSIQLFCLSMIGEYLAKVYMEAKRRPRYIVEKSI
jgi:glycosyltransferase involved in cell wall biosynthesis